ncbi:TetR/AcrR family transcriptional regulator [Lactobacillus sp. Sy-1]|uniref:TetR/AcrR family transcriptional regulator n=1 Tax=Lactobacillus sp. Sy-1 TaxID=2109645 RepID=UPI001C5823CB|nr:TetR/AcrR family transcriptional regulator [Lactobacillus sp. Sy-1]MBW1605202.1 TetR/AcrR family transcriptional regulator [Lactobacillus sp. Sy-1]
MTDKSIKRQRQVNQTIDWFVESLVQLLERKQYQQITIKGLAERAGLSTRTFYRHFTSIDDVLKIQLDHYNLGLLKTLRDDRPVSFPEMVTIFFEYSEQHKQFLLALYRNQLTYLLLANLRSHMGESLLSQFNLKQRKYVYSFSIGGIGNLLLDWLQNDAKQSPNEMRSIAQAIGQHLIDVM